MTLRNNAYISQTFNGKYCSKFSILIFSKDSSIFKSFIFIDNILLRGIVFCFWNKHCSESFQVIEKE